MAKEHKLADWNERKIVDLNEILGAKRRLPRWICYPIEKFLGLDHLNIGHYKIESDLLAGNEGNFYSFACKHFNLLYDLNESALENIPKEGPCVVVCNHPHGFSDGIMFGDVVMKARSDIRIVVNEFLYCIRCMRPYSITVDVYGGDQAKRANMASMKALLQWLREGHCVLVFPSGSAATYSRKDGRVIDDEWQTNIAALIRKTKASVVPMHISGRTGIFFQLISTLCKSKRSSFLPRELIRDGKMPHQIRLGSCISPQTMSLLENDAALSDYLRLRTMLLSYPSGQEVYRPASEQGMKPVAAASEKQVLVDEIASLPPEALYYSNESAGLTVYAVRAQQIPHMMHEISVQREIVFRSVGEGTGEPFDRDAYDDYYMHLIMWDCKAQALAGAYRMGLTDEIIKEHGFSGIYNAQFFKVKPALEQELAKGIEMGRAFITLPYQRLLASLDTLWMGIGRFLVRHPQYKYLYGTVSISAEYSWHSRALILSYLQSEQMNEELKNEIKALDPPKNLTLRSEDIRLIPRALADVRTLSSLVSDLEEGKRGIPVLLKHYLRLNGKMLSFGIDESFGNTLDCLVLVDLDKAPERIMKRYKGL